MTTQAAPDNSQETLEQTRGPFFQFLKSQGSSEPTLYSYGRDFDVISQYFKPDKRLQNILAAHVGAFLKADLFLKKKDGTPRAKPTRDKIARVLRMFLIWALSTGRLKQLPIPQDARLGARSIKEKTERRQAKGKKPKPEPEQATEPVSA